VYVKPDWRGLHLASALVEACCEWGKEQGMTQARLEVITSNTSAIRSYSRIGFRVFGIDPQAILSEGVHYDNLLMVKELE
jgi:ribosomal protein S18 acetylase RimI-like enzyme